MAAYGRAVESRELRAVQPGRWASRGSYQHGADGRRGDTQSTHHDCERRILAERHGPSPDHGYFREGARPLRPRSRSSPLSQRERWRGGEALVDGSNPQNDAPAGATTRGASAGHAPEGTPAGWRRRGHYDL